MRSFAIHRYLRQLRSEAISNVEASIARKEVESCMRISQIDVESLDESFCTEK